MTIALMLVFAAAYAAVALIGMKYRPGKESFFDIHDTTVLKGIFCVLVVLVHVPEGYRNPIQDAMGSFAYIGVTFFFLASAYGLKWGAAHKPGYLKRFWLKRLPAILVPSFLSWFVCMAVSVPLGFSWLRFKYVALHAWVRVLLIFYFVFWLFYWLPEKMEKVKGLRAAGSFLRRYRDVFICLAVAAMSLMSKLTPVKPTDRWITESMGFAYGIILANVYDKYKGWANERWWTKCAVFLVLSAVLGVGYLKFKPVWFYGDYCLKIVLGIAILMLVLQAVRRVTLNNRALVFLGNISYEVFLIHDAIFTVLETKGYIKNSALFLFADIAITVVLAAAVRKLTEPIIRKLKK